MSRRPAVDLDPDSDLGERLVATAVGPLSDAAIDRALAAGKPSLLNIRVRSQISPRAQGVVDSRKQGGAF